ncbi:MULTISPECIES: hypothetical protein [unclassified Chromohalobacter]|uniref:hypothetical protein n=1 Tax=unclassified Chromohalobacter TaxID=2628571 RepID=UPI002469C5F7|nr:MULTISPECIES: hypothetical protein [unclassified Chromohalobacter]
MPLRPSSCLILAMLVVSIACALLHLPLWPAAILGWLATFRLSLQLPRASQRQAMWLGLVGVIIWGVALWRETPASLVAGLSVNQPLLMMFAGVSFLSMARPLEDNDTQSERRGSFWGTLLGVHLFGAVINLSVLFLFGDRMQRQGRLTRQQAIVLGRAFPAAAAWSPFFVAMGVALTYAPGIDFLALLPWGLFASLLLLALVTIDALRLPGEFIGYPLGKSSLVLPGVLALSVIVAHFIWPSLSIPLIISIVSPLFATLLVPSRERRDRLHKQLNDGLPRLGPQFALFLAAGLISSGLAALLASAPDRQFLPLDHFGSFAAWITQGILVILAFVGIHPLVGIATIAPLVQPLGPDPTLLGMLFLMSWALGTGCSPLSGSNLALCVRYGIKSRDMMRWNLPYALLGWLACGAVFALYAWWQTL